MLSVLLRYSLVFFSGKSAAVESQVLQMIEIKLLGDGGSEKAEEIGKKKAVLR